MVNFYAPCSSNIGYGVHSYNIIQAYSKINPNVSLIPPFGGVSFQNEHVKRWLDNRVKISKNDTGIMIFNEPFMAQFSGKVRIGFPVFEMEKFDDVSLAMMRTCDYLLTPSRWGKQVLKDNNFRNVYVVPEGYDPEIFYPDYNLDYKLYRIARDGLTFVHVGKLEERKGTKDVIRAMDLAFGSSKKKVTLILHCYNRFDTNWALRVDKYLTYLGFEPIHSSFQNIFSRRKKNLTIEIPQGTLDTAQEIASLYRAADFGIFLSKSEGWGLPLMECIACGTPAITTSWTGMSEYLREYPQGLKVDGGSHREIANDGVWFKGDRGEWRVPNLIEVKELLQEIGNNAKAYLELEKDCLAAVKKFTWENAAKRLDFVLRKEIGVK